MLFSISFVVILLVMMILKGGDTGSSPVVVFVVVYASCIVAAVAILRNKIVFAFRPPNRIEAANAIGWDWAKSWWLIIRIGVVLWLIPIGYALVASSLSIRTVQPAFFLEGLLTQLLIVGVAEELFFREAALSEWVDRPLTGLFISSLAFFIFHLYQGFPQAMIAGGIGVVYGVLRLSGVNILVVAGLHGLTNVLYSRVLSINLSEHQLLPYSTYFFAACLVLSAVTYCICTYSRHPDENSPAA